MLMGKRGSFWQLRLSRKGSMRDEAIFMIFQLMMITFVCVLVFVFIQNKVTDLGFEKRFIGTHFNEFVIKSTIDAKKINKELLKKNIQGGLIIDKWFPELKNCILFGITETHNEEEIKKLLSALKEVSNV